MSEAERAQANATRAPTNQVNTNKCPAKVRHGDNAGEPCSRTAGQGTSHQGFGYCSKHGGNTPSGKKAAARAMGRELILQQKERFGGDRDNVYIRNITAEQALLEEVRRSTAMVRFLEEKIGQWQLEGATGELRSDGDLGLPALVEETSKGAPGATDVQAWLLLYREERAHMAKVAKMCIDANISKRLVDLAETQGQVLHSVIAGVLKALNLTELQAQAVPTIVPQVIARAQYELSTANNKDGNKEAPALGKGTTPYKITDLT